VEVSGQLHASAALPPGKEPLVPVGYEAGQRKQYMKLEKSCKKLKFERDFQK
jgi:hypothetical protein